MLAMSDDMAVSRISFRLPRKGAYGWLTADEDDLSVLVAVLFPESVNVSLDLRQAASRYSLGTSLGRDEGTPKVGVHLFVVIGLGHLESRFDDRDT